MRSWAGRRALVTGAGGFIGGHLAVALAREGASVRALCRYNSRADRGTLEWFDPAAVNEIDVRFGDLRDPDSVGSAVEGMEVVFHLGAQIAIPYSLIAPRDFLATNVEGTMNVAQAALRAEVERMLHVSTSEVYGQVLEWPITERHPVAPRSPYAATKAGADLLVGSFIHSLGLRATIARPFNTYGPHQSARAIVPTIAAQALSPGGRLRLGSLEPRRDLTFVEDTVAGLMALAASEATLGETVQLGSGHDVSVGDLVGVIGELTGRPLEPELDAERVRPPDGEVWRLLCDHSRATELTGWAPQVTLREGLERTLRWIAENRGRFREAEYAR